MEFEPKNRNLILKPSGNVSDKVAFIQKLYDKTDDKINHLDRLRQQLLNFAILIFSGLLVFVTRSQNALAQTIACLGVAGLMTVFRHLDQRYHKFTHGYRGSMFVFSQAIAYLLDDPDQELELYQYCTEAEKNVEWWALQTKVYLALAGVTVLLAGIIPIAEIAGC